MSDTVQTQVANGYLSIALPTGDLPTSLSVNGAGLVTSLSVVYYGKTSTTQNVNGVTYTQTFTRNGAGVVTAISGWVPQP